MAVASIPFGYGGAENHNASKTASSDLTVTPKASPSPACETMAGPRLGDEP